MVERCMPKTLDEAYVLAAEAKKGLDVFGKMLSEKFGCEFVAAPLKGRERAEEKLSAKYRGDVSRLQDLARCRVVCDSLDQIDIIRKAVRKNADVLREVDRMDKPNESGYRDLKFICLEKNGFPVEMQIQLKDFAAVGDETHRHYEKIRAITAQAKDRPLTETEQKEIALRKKICQGIFMGAAQAFNRRTKGRKLKLQPPQPAWAAFLAKTGAER